MTEESDTDLLKRAETALSTLSYGEPDWDGLAQRIEGAVASAPAEDATLFEAPLPAAEGEGGAEEAPVSAAAGDSVPGSAAGESERPVASTESDPGPSISVASESADELDDGWASSPEAGAEEGAGAEAPAAILSQDDAESVPATEAPESPREGVSLADLARASVARRGSAERANIAKESLAVASQSRAQSDQIAQRVQAASVLSQQAPTSVAPPPPSARAGGDALRGPWIGVTIAAIGLAASFALVLSGRNNQPVAIVETAPQPPTAERTTPTVPPQTPVAKADAPVAPEPPAAKEATLDPSSLPTLPREPAPHTEAKPEAPVAKAPAKAPAPAPAPAGKVAAEKIVLEEDHKAAPKSAPSATTPRPADAKLRPAELSSSEMTDRPSAGAAQAAVGSVLGAARACVAGHPQPSSAQLVFGSDGQVQSVTVAGPAAGTAAAGCIEAALKKARVQPFAASSFSLGVTVRPP